MDRPGPVAYDAEVRLHDEVLRRACGVQPHEHVLDIGCGTGQTTCEAARLARAARSAAAGSAGPDPFFLADPPAVTRILEVVAVAGTGENPLRTGRGCRTLADVFRFAVLAARALVRAVPTAALALLSPAGALALGGARG